MSGVPEFFYDVWVELVVAAIGAVAVGMWGLLSIKAKWSVPQAIVYGLVAFAALLVIFGRVWPRLEAQTQIQRWLDRGGYSVRRVGGSGQVFDFEVTERGERKIRVYQPSYKGAPILIEATLDVTQNVRDAIAALGERGKHEFLISLQLSMMQYGIGYEGIGDPLKVVVFQDMFIYEDSMPEREFIQRVVSVIRAVYYLSRESSL